VGRDSETDPGVQGTSRHPPRGIPAARFGIWRARLRAAAFVILSWVPIAHAQGSLEFELLGPGTASEDPVQLGARVAPGKPESLIRDLDEGTWWRGRMSGPVDHGASNLPLAFTFKGSYSTTLTLWHPASGWRIERNRFRQPGPDWSNNADQLVVVPEALLAGEPFYVHVRDRTHRRIRPQVQSLDDYLSAAAGRRSVAIASAAALITLALLAAVFVNSLGNVAYRHLALMAFLAAGYVLALNGDLYHLIRSEALLRHGTRLSRTFALSAIAFSHFFIVVFLRLRERRRVGAKVLAALAWAQIGIIVATWLEGPNPAPWGATAGNLLLLIGVPTVLWEAWVAQRHGIRSGSFVLWAWSPGLLLLTVWVFALQDWLPRAAVDVGALVSIFLAVQVAVLVFGLGDDSARLRRERDRATSDAEHDALTGALNRRALQSRLRELQADAETGRLSLAYMDLDHFKRINDVHGHAAGDQCLRQLVRRLAPQQRPGDLLARIGGEEFVLVMQGLDGPSATGHADMLRQRVAAEAFQVDQQRIAITTSFGIAEWQPGESPESLMQRADQALYRAKAQGRNCVVLDEPTLTIAPVVGGESA
jgi:diguanylate cyclase (GGDEF)-like protein